MSQSSFSSDESSGTWRTLLPEDGLEDKETDEVEEVDAGIGMGEVLATAGTTSALDAFR